ncbi:hypothetical protein G7046_g6609 [Stylonectria norvegica]|nr:hypothetical protein G7046_g6609 [Stylonectria norvegica]
MGPYPRGTSTSSRLFGARTRRRQAWQGLRYFAHAAELTRWAALGAVEERRAYSRATNQWLGRTSLASAHLANNKPSSLKLHLQQAYVRAPQSSSRSLAARPTRLTNRHLPLLSTRACRTVSKPRDLKALVWNRKNTLAALRRFGRNVTIPDLSRLRSPQISPLFTVFVQSRRPFAEEHANSVKIMQNGLNAPFRRDEVRAALALEAHSRNRLQKDHHDKPVAWPSVFVGAAAALRSYRSVGTLDLAATLRMTFRDEWRTACTPHRTSASQSRPGDSLPASLRHYVIPQRGLRVMLYSSALIERCHNCWRSGGTAPERGGEETGAEDGDFGEDGAQASGQVQYFDGLGFLGLRDGGAVFSIPPRTLISSKPASISIFSSKRFKLGTTYTDEHCTCGKDLRDVPARGHKARVQPPDIKAKIVPINITKTLGFIIGKTLAHAIDDILDLSKNETSHDVDPCRHVMSQLVQRQVDLQSRPPDFKGIAEWLRVTKDMLIANPPSRAPPITPSPPALDTAAARRGPAATFGFEE